MMKKNNLFISPEWYRTMPGCMLVAQEKIALHRWLSSMRGDLLLQLGGPSDLTITDSIKMKRIRVIDSCEMISGGVDLVSCYSSLPILSDSVDVVLLVHVLEREHDVLPLLTDISRVLKPNGQLIVVSLNIWGLWRMFLPTKNFLSANKIKHCLYQLNFRLAMYQTVCYRPPIKNQKLARQLLFLDTLGQIFFPYFGTSFVMVMRKKVIAGTPLLSSTWNQKIRWIEKQSVVRPTIRSL